MRPSAALPEGQCPALQLHPPRLSQRQLHHVALHVIAQQLLGALLLERLSCMVVPQ